MYMKRLMGQFLILLVFAGSAVTVFAADINSPGKPAAAITLNGIEGGGEWAGAYNFTISDYGLGTIIYPLSAQVKALHKADGIYLLLVISDDTSNNADALQIRLDTNHNGVIDAGDTGVEVRRDGSAVSGPLTTDIGLWTAYANAAVFPLPPTPSATWTVEVKVPNTGVNYAAGSGIHFMLYDADQVFGGTSAMFTQWPAPTIADVDGLETLFDTTPAKWGNYLYDPATTYPNVSVLGVRRTDGDPANYYKINYSGSNDFHVRVRNLGGTVVNDAVGVRLNLYLAAIGLGEPWHRLDTAAILDSDCAAATWASPLILKSDVCSSGSSLPDISTMTINNVVANTAKYTIKDGNPMSRIGGDNITVAGGSDTWEPVIGWNTTATQDDFFKEVIIGGSTYRRQHQCMRAEAIYLNDPNPSDNAVQVNMDFVGVPGSSTKMLKFSMGAAGFGKYDPAKGKDMFLKLETRNIDPQAGWKFGLEGVERLGENFYKTRMSGIASRSMQFGLTVPSQGIMGGVLKENLIVPPQAGGRTKGAALPSGLPPVYVRITPSTTLTIVNYAFDDNDMQSVDLDGEKRLLPQNGPAGLPRPYLARFLREVGDRFKLLLAPQAPIGALVGSFDNFKTAFVVAEGVQVQVPKDAAYLALAINDVYGLYDDNTGTGFRVKVTEKRSLGGLIRYGSLVPEALAQDTAKVKAVPIEEIMPMVCINGYEKIGKTRVVAAKERELYRFIGNVCWGIVNVYNPERKPEPDRGDVYEEGQVPEPRPICGPVKSDGFAMSGFFAIAGVVIIGLRARRRRDRK